MKTPIALWDEFTILGKWFSWWIIPTYYISILILKLLLVTTYSIFKAWDDL